MSDFVLHLENGCCGLNNVATEKRIGNLIDKSGLNDKELSEKMNVSVQAINKWRHSKGFPDIENLCILSRLLGCKVDDLLVLQWKEKTMLTATLEERKKNEVVSEIIRKYYFMVAAVVHLYHDSSHGRHDFQVI